MTVKQLYIDATEALNLNIVISGHVRAEGYIASYEFPSIDSNQRRGFLNKISTLYRMERVKSSLMNMMQDDQSRSSKYAVATVPAISLLMALAVCLSPNCREREGESSSEDKVTWWGDHFPRHICDIRVPGLYLKPEAGVLRCNFRWTTLSELGVVVREIH